MKNIWIVPTLALALFSQACIIVEDESTLTIVNESSRVIEEIYVAPIGDRYWSNEIMGGDVLFPNESIEIGGFECDYYDVKIVGDNGYECILPEVDLCLDDAVWYVDNYTLTFCI